MGLVEERSPTWYVLPVERKRRALLKDYCVKCVVGWVSIEASVRSNGEGHSH